MTTGTSKRDCGCCGTDCFHHFEYKESLDERNERVGVKKSR